MSDGTPDKQYFFVSYSHKDEDAVAHELDWLNQAGIGTWLDEGIRPGASWHKELANHLKGSRGVLFFVTPSSIASDNCSREIQFAVQSGIPVIAVHLEPTDLPDEWTFAIGNYQAIFRYKHTHEEFRDRLLASLSEFADADTAVETQPPVTPTPAQPATQRVTGWKVRAVGFSIAAVLAAAIYLLTPVSDAPQPAETTTNDTPRPDSTWLTSVALPAMRGAIHQDNYGAAYREAEKIEEAGFAEFLTPDDWSDVSVNVDVVTDPPDAEIFFKLYAEGDDAWTSIGRSPVENARLPRDLIVLRAEKAGYETALRVTHSPGIFSRNAAYDYRMRSVFDEFQFRVPIIEMMAEGDDADMVTIPESGFSLMFPSFSPIQRLDIPSYRMAKTEVTNAEYKSFVEASGYEDPGFWASLEFFDNGKRIPWEETVTRFVDQTGRPGPGSWAFGTYPDGQDDYPVSGVSWFEAMAYANYRGKRLPSIVHWIRSAIMLFEGAEPIGPQMLPASNFAGEVAPVGSGGLGPYGAYDLAGNLREWASNKHDGEHVALGGAFDDPPYAFYNMIPVSPFDRSLKNGIRLAEFPSTPPAATLEDINQLAFERRKEPLPPDYVLANTPQYPADDVPLEPVLVYEEDREVGHLRKISLFSGRTGGERFWVYIWTPNNQSGPFDVVVYQGGFGGFASRYELEKDMPWIEKEVFDLVLRSGRAVAWPVLLGSYDRYDDLESTTPETDRWQELVEERGRQQVRELRYLVNYFEAYDEFTGRAAYLGLSYGAIWHWWNLMYEPRFKASIQLVGGINWVPGREIQAIDVIQLIETPALFLNGRFDSLVAPEQAKLAYKYLATPEADKRLVQYDAGHWPLPRNQITREIVNFLDKYLGPPAGRSPALPTANP